MTDQTNTPDPLDVAVGQRIRLTRKARGLSMEKIGEHLDVSWQQVAKYETGSNRVSASMLIRIAERLDTTVAALVGEDEAAKAPPDALSAFVHSGPGLRLAAAAKDLPPHVLSAVIGLAKDLGATNTGARG
jgi:transcriptional regulator with XRE-family HTH domain